MNFKYLAAALVFGLSTATAPATANSTDTPLTQDTFIQISKSVLPSVVSIDVSLPVSKKIQNDYGVDSAEELFRKFWLEREGSESPGLFDWEQFQEYDMDDFGYRGSGSGVVLHEDENGWAYVVTNLHVIETDPRAHVNKVDSDAQFTINLDSQYDVKVQEVAPEHVELVGYDELTDIAVLRFRVPEGVNFAEVGFADSDEVEIGEWVLALGNPLELNNSVSQGIVSAKNRTLGTGNRIERLLQTTAVINPGNSGGPLVNLDGKIVGINNAIATQTGRWAGIGFAIPSNEANYAVQQIISKGKVSRGYLGVSMYDVDDIRSSVYDYGLLQGVSIEEVRPDTPAEDAGLKKGDVIFEVDGMRIRNSQALLAAIAGHRAGDEVGMRVRRYDGDGESEEFDVEVLLAERPTEEALVAELNNRRLSDESRQKTESLGLELTPGDEGSYTGMHIDEVQPRSASARAGLRKGDFIIQINGIDVTSVAKLHDALENVNERIGHVIVFRRDGSTQTVTIDSE